MSKIPVLIDTDGQMDSLWGLILAKRLLDVRARSEEHTSELQGSREAVSAGREMWAAVSGRGQRI